MKRALNSLSFRILALLLGVLSIILLVTLVVVRSATLEHSTGQLVSYAFSAKAVVRDKILSQTTLLENALQDLAKNFSVIKLVAGAKEDAKSLESAMQNYQMRFSADLYQVLDEDKKLLAGSVTQPLPVDVARLAEPGIHWFALGDSFYLLRAVPMRFVQSSPLIKGWLVMGVNAQSLLNRELAGLAGLEVSLLLEGETKQTIGSTLEPNQQRALAAQTLALDDTLHQTRLGESEYIYTAQRLTPGSPYLIVLATPEEAAYLSYNSLIGQLALVLFASGLIALIAASVTARSITRPVNQLVSATHRIQRGEYVSEFPHCSTHEVDALTTAIRDMQDGIKKREEQINELAYYDALTKLPNRNQFNEKLIEAILACKNDKVLVALMDIDRFREINDTVGHTTGDLLLHQVAERLGTFYRQNDFFAHLGGDEFAMILRSATKVPPGLIGAELAQLFDRPFNISGLVLDVNISIGLASYPTDANNVAELMQHADIALHACKDHHDPYMVYTPALNKHSVQRLNLMSELKEALAAGQLSLYYQPKLSIASHQIDSVECLVRWIHPTDGFIPPDEFIGLAEQTGAIRDLTQWALRTALAQQREWRNDGLDLKMAINISAVDLIDMKLPALVSECLSDFDADAGSVILEVTESAIMSDPQSALKALNTLRRMGVKLSIDDFGTGYSSMAQLKDMPVNELKIDKAFVLDLASNKDDQVMVKTLIDLANNLGMETVAEGVEDAASLAILAAHGCTRAQGFHLSKPLPQEQFKQWIYQFSEDNRQLSNE